jgi:hypothetical protein
MLYALGIGTLSIWETVVIAVMSGLIGLTATALVTPPVQRRLISSQNDPKTAADVGLFVAFSLGIGIRIAGTVALLVTSSYHMVSWGLELACWVLGWYVYLTTVEVLNFVSDHSIEHESADCRR